METKMVKTWFLLIDHTFQTLIGGLSSVRTSVDEDIDDLKVKVKEKWQYHITDVSPASLTVWRTKGDLIINKENIKMHLPNILSEINIDDEDTIEQLDVDVQVSFVTYAEEGL
ncbi:hypothetical protein EDB89DRAFT_1903360 [Lactarius sanguifluus]|nr:hypothetical protein EDB89DRAFT_1903360 [Lactarius sanguifluus]